MFCESTFPGSSPREHKSGQLLEQFKDGESVILRGERLNNMK